MGLSVLLRQRLRGYLGTSHGRFLRLAAARIRPNDAKVKNSITMCDQKMYFIFALAILEYIVYFTGNNHFFQGDTIHWFYVRHKTAGDFILNFFKLDSGGWYRPLTNGSVQSMFFPMWGLNPSGYRIVQYL